MELSTGEEGFGGEARRSLVHPSAGVCPVVRTTRLSKPEPMLMPLCCSQGPHFTLDRVFGFRLRIRMVITGGREKQLGMRQLVVNNGTWTELKSLGDRLLVA
ncbi:hypothetical protein F2Q68_00018234 [Brassica cretica]|uniref:Uncharacterized protein n=1 Tax=Brassica cretica TaxID=69181 RepID=A0A8S9HK99_BRACR|nr:hypothetical protein F2Q68_00018234 [Brassica cretica]